MARKISFLFFNVIFGLQFTVAQENIDLDSIWKTIDLDDVVVTAQYSPTHSKNAVHEVVVIKAKDIEQQGQNNLSEVLTNQLNLRVSNDPILGNGLKIQGIGGENIQIMIDGVPVIGRVGGNIDLSQIQLNNIDRIELIEGAMSAQFGSNASGGVVNIITKKSQTNPFKFESVNQYENVGIWNNSLLFGVRFGKFYASVNGSRIDYDFAPIDSLRVYETNELPTGETYKSKKIPWNPKTQYSFDGMARYRFNDSLSLTYQYRYFDELLSSYGEVRRTTYKPYAFDEFYTTNRQDHSLNFEGYLGQKFYLNSTTAYNQYDRFKETTRLDFENDSTSTVAGGQDTTNFINFLHRTVLSTSTNKKLNGQLGFEILHETGTGQRIVDSTSMPLNEAVLTNYAGWISMLYDPIAELKIQANLRYGYNTKYDHPLIPSLNIQWKPNKKFNFRLNYAHGFRAPSLKELYHNFIDINHYIIGNPNLKAENSKNASVSADFETSLNKKHRFTLSGKLFYNAIENRIVLAEYEPAKYNYQNLEQFETHGINFRLKYFFGKRLRIQSGIAFTKIYNYWSEDYDSEKFTTSTELQNELSYKIPMIETDFVVMHRYFGQQIQFFENEAGSLEQGTLGDYHFLNVTVSRRFWKNRIFLALGVKNILDVQSIPFSGQTSGGHAGTGINQIIGWGRTYFARINLTIN